MGKQQGGKTPKITKSFMTVGPTLHYSHANVQRCWVLAIIVFAATCLFWSKILTGSIFPFDLTCLTQPGLCRLGRFTENPLSIFQYPWQILVIGLLMAIISAVPIIVSQLLSFRYSIIFILCVAVLANLPFFSLFVLVGCFATATRPLRFRSRIISIALCTAPEVIYWTWLGSIPNIDPIKWGFSFTPWICAWLGCLIIAGIILGIGHYTRYRPGLIWIVSCLVLVIAISIFQKKIGFAELDYQLHVAKNNPEKVTEFHDHSITKSLDDTIANPSVKSLAGFFYPTEPILLRSELKREIALQLNHGQWPSWFILPKELNFDAKKRWLTNQFQFFTKTHPRSQRMAIALYYEALLSEYSPDIRLLDQKEILHFYSDYARQVSRPIWYRLYEQFGQSPESLEARWRIATHLARQGKFTQAQRLLAEAQKMLAEYLSEKHHQPNEKRSIFTAFRSPDDTVMTAFKLTELQVKLSRLSNLISEQNRTNDQASRERLARFVTLNPYGQTYYLQLEQLLSEMDKNDPLRDNVVLAKTLLTPDEQLRAQQLSELHEKFVDSDGGTEALYELALLKVRLWQRQSDEAAKEKKKYLSNARASLDDLIELYPESIFTNQAKTILKNLPAVE